MKEMNSLIRKKNYNYFQVLRLASVGGRPCPGPSVQVSISSTFYEQLFYTKVFFKAFLKLQFGFVIFCWKNISAKAARKILLKLTIVRNV